MRDHGGNIDGAIARHGGAAGDWIDLSTGINRVPYPVPDLPHTAWTALPTRAATGALVAAAQSAYGTTAPLLPLAGAQAAIQMIPRLGPLGRAAVLGPTYNEHAACLSAAGWKVSEARDLQNLAGADIAVLVNPNNPDGRYFSAAEILALVGKVGLLIVDESFADAAPGQSVAARAGRGGLVVLRSFGKFYGLAGLRLGFAIGDAPTISALADMAGPWPVSGAAIEIGRRALADRAWASATVRRLKAEVPRIDALAKAAGWRVEGGTELFRLYSTPNAQEAQERLARARIWSRIFPYSATWLRLGLPGSPDEWDRLRRALA